MADWEKVKDKVTVRVIGVSRNTELLKEIPCRLFGDIALIYQVSVKAPDDTLMTVRITNNLMEQYGISEPQLYDTAMENSQRLQKVTCRPMGEVIGDLLYKGMLLWYNRLKNIRFEMPPSRQPIMSRRICLMTGSGMRARRWDLYDDRQG